MASGDVQCEENSTVPKGSGHNEGLARKGRGETGVVVVLSRKAGSMIKEYTRHK